MTQICISAWSQGLQTKLMAAIDAAWKLIETSDDPVAVRKARDRVKACGELAAVVRKVAAMTGLPALKPSALAPVGLSAPQGAALSQVEYAQRALDKLKGGRRGRL